MVRVGVSGVDDDHRMPYFSSVAMLTNIYASSKVVVLESGKIGSHVQCLIL